VFESKNEKIKHKQATTGMIC